MNASTHLVATRPADSLGDPGGKDDHEFLFTVVVTCEGCFGFMTFSKVFTTPARDPGAPRGLLGSRGVRRNLANTLGASQVSLRFLGALEWIPGILIAQQGALRDCAIGLIHCFDLGLPQGSCGSLGVTELFSEILVVHRIALVGPQGNFEPFWEFGGRRPHRSPRHGNLCNKVFEASEFDNDQSKKADVSGQVHVQHYRIGACIGCAFQSRYAIISICIGLGHSRGN